MAYKLIKEWKGVIGDHEITVYKYNISHDETVRYYYEPNSGVGVIKRTFLTQGDEDFEEIYEVA